MDRREEKKIIWLSQKDYDKKNWDQKKEEERAKASVLSPKAQEMKNKVGYVF